MHEEKHGRAWEQIRRYLVMSYRGFNRFLGVFIQFMEGFYCLVELGLKSQFCFLSIF